MITHTKRQGCLWEPCINVGAEATVDVYVRSSQIIHRPVELTREDLESMLSSLDDLENT